MATPAPPKPWERSGGAASTLSSPASTVIGEAPPPTSSTSGAPTVPQRPASLTSSTTESALVPRTISPYNTTAPYNTTTPYNSMNSYTSPYSTYGTSSYMSPYNRLGMGGYGGYNSYGSYGGGYGGYGGYGGGYGMSPYGMPGVDPVTGQPSSLMQQVEASTSQTFTLIQSIVGTFTGFAQMLESTFMATHSSFFAMLGVAEQFSQLRMALGQVVGIFGFVGWLRGWWKGDRRNFRNDFKKFLRGEDVGASGHPAAPKPSRKPLIIFLIAVFGLPYLMHRVIKHVAARLPPPPPMHIGADGKPQVIDPANLTFVRAVYPFETKDPQELALTKGELVAVLSTTDPVTGAEGEWWRGRTREGREGWFPRNFVEIIKKKSMDGGVISTPTAVVVLPAGKIVE